MRQKKKIFKLKNYPPPPNQLIYSKGASPKKKFIYFKYELSLKGYTRIFLKYNFVKVHTHFYENFFA